MQQTYKPIIKELRHALSMVLKQNATAITLIPREFGVWVGEIHDKELLKDAEFIIAASAELPAEVIRQHFPTQVKIAPVEQIRNLVSRALPGIDVQALSVAPRQIPYHANYSYFVLNRHHEYWQDLATSGGIALHVGSNFPGLKLEFWAIRG